MQAYEREIVGDILGQVFADKYAPAFGDDRELAADVASIVPLSGNTYLALADFMPAGTATLHLNGATGFGWDETALMWRTIRNRIGFFRTVRAFFMLSGGVGELDRWAGYISSVAVLPEYRRSGVGTALMHRVEEDARNAGKVRLGLHVLETNSGARRLYKGLGYKVVKVVTTPQTPWRKTSAIHFYMTKDLAR